MVRLSEKYIVYKAIMYSKISLVQKGYNMVQCTVNIIGSYWYNNGYEGYHLPISLMYNVHENTLRSWHFSWMSETSPNC